MDFTTSVSNRFITVNTPSTVIHMETPRTLAARVKELREGKNLTQEQLSEAVGMSQEWASNIETGKIKLPRTATLDRLAKVLGVSTADLYIAAGVARTGEEGRRVAEHAASYVAEEDDPLLHTTFIEMRKLSHEDLSQIRDLIKRMTRDRS